MKQESQRRNRRKNLEAHVPQFTVGVVAERIGVPIATLRSWNQRYGVGPSDHRPGRHRLYSENDVSALTRMHRLIGEGASARIAARVALDAAAPQRADTGSLLTAAFGLNLDSVQRQLDSHLQRFGVIDTWDRLILPVFSVVELKQAQGEECIDVEHALSWAVSRSLQRMPAPASRTPASTILAGTAGETHTLALEALRAALAERGHDALMLGADVPVSAINDALRRTATARAVVLWAQTPATADAVAAKAVIAAQATLMVGGAGWKSVRLPNKAIRPDSLQSARAYLTGENSVQPHR